MPARLLLTNSNEEAGIDHADCALEKAYMHGVSVHAPDPFCS